MRLSFSPKWTLLLTYFTLALSCPNDLHCKMCLGQKCLLCANTFPSPDVNCCQLPPVSLSNCYIYSSATQCAICQPGFFRSQNSICLPMQGTLSTTCALGGQNALTCVVCANGVLESGGNCGSKTGCSDVNCQLCYHDSNGVEQCYLCNRGYYGLIGSTSAQNFCTAENSATSNCDKTTSPNFCLVCKAGFYHQNGLCLQSDYTYFTAVTSIIRWWLLLTAFGTRLVDF